MKGTITIPQQVVDSYQEEEEPVSVKIIQGNPVVEVEAYVNGRMKILPADMSTVWASLTDTQKTTIKTFLKYCGVTALNFYHAQQTDGVTVSDTDFTDFELQSS